MQAGDLPRSLAYARRAARNATRVFALDEALKFLDQARESAEALHRDSDIAAIDELIGDTHEARGVVAAAIEGYERALARVSAGDARAALKSKIGQVYCQVGDARGLPYLEEALAELDPATRTNELALSMAFVGRYHHYRTEHRKAIEFLERARQLAEPLDDPATLASIYSFLAGANQHLLEYAVSDDWSRKSIAFGERKNYPLAMANGYEFLAENCAGRGLWKETLGHATRDRELGTRSGSLARVAWADFATVQALQGTGRLAEARAVAQGALKLCEQIGEFRLATWLDPALATIAADMGDDDAARVHAGSALQRAQQLQQLVLTAWALHAAGYAAMRRDDVDEAMRMYAQYLPLLRETENGIVRNFMLGAAAEAHLRAGRVDEAAALVAQAIGVAEFAGAPHYLALDLRVQGQVFAAQGRHDDARVALDRAIALFEQTGSRLELNRALLCRAVLLREHGNDAEKAAARTDTEAARDAFAAMGAVHDRERAERLRG